MGNPEIIGGWPGGTPVQPPNHRAIWLVYRLRDRGAKMPPDIALRTGNVGTLEFWRPSSQPEQLNARLWDASGYPALDHLDNVRLVKGTPGGGLLLYGTTLSVKGGYTSEVRQAWWCVVHSIGPPAAEKIPRSLRPEG